jgi:hypothetical protein
MMESGRGEETKRRVVIAAAAPINTSMRLFLPILCSGGVERLLFIEGATRIITIVFFVFGILVLYRAYPPKVMAQWYPSRGAYLRSILPFSKRWQNEVSREHVPRIRAFRKRFFTFESILVACFVFVFVYSHVLLPRLVLMYRSGACGNRS